jgi:molecular chaperone GrpE
MENPFKKAFEGSKDTELNEKHVEIEDSEEETESPENSEETETNSEEEVAAESAEEPQKNEWQEKYEKLNDQYIRLAADFDNFRKRQAQERESLLRYGAESTVTKLLEVMDNFDRGLKAIETVEDCGKVKECYNLAYKNFYDVMTKIGLETIKAIGEEFDPNLHEAVMQTPSSEHPEHTIIAELQKGYKLGDKVIRPTLVNVATAEE